MLRMPWSLLPAQVPHYYVTVASRMDALLGLRAQINEALAASGEGKLSVNDFIVKASALVRALTCDHAGSKTELQCSMRT